MTTTPASLLERLRQPNREAAWDRFVKLYTPLLAHWGRRLGLSGPDADDLLQDVFTLLVRKLPEFEYDRTKRFRAWLWTVTLNKHREKLRRHELAIQQTSNGALGQLAGSDTALQLDETEYRHYVVQRALQLMQAEFPLTTWKAFWEYVVAGRPASEVASELNLSLDQVYTAKSRILRCLRRELEGLLD
jgi:RNA polymerase sigma-70 factor (ECF subfamily)